MNLTTTSWKKTLEFFEKNHNDDYLNWIIDINFLSFEKKTRQLSLSVSNQFIKDTILAKFKTLIEETFSRFINLDKVQLNLIISEQANIFHSEQEKEKPKEDNFNQVVKFQSNKNYQTNIDPRLTFERFVVGSDKNNKLPYLAALSLVQNPGQEYSYNPFFIYGGVGLGKTHLMQAIGNYILKHRPDLKVIYVTAENYLNDYIKSANAKRYDSFRAKYRDVDFLLIDDIQFLEGKKGTQEEFFNNFNYLRDHHKNLVFTCDKPPKELKNIEERLITRLNWGLVLDIKPPDLETRKLIIEKKLKENQVYQFINQEIIDFLSEHITSNVRDIESAVAKIKLYTLFENKTIMLEMLEDYLSDVLTFKRIKKNHLSCKIIQEKVSEYYQISFSDLKSNKRNKDISFPRQMAMYLSKEILNLPFADIGEQFSGRDHSTVIASYNKIKEKMTKDKSIRNDYEELFKILSQL
ncbi:MAG TPA: chromosomal replication initiator protein DnaA [Spirochaetia bacterium]|nr:MAG: chromosomal replication initiator protein DnaA [Spirochaetes bacterium GWB1_36_13]HCL57689.1 chromosomal replication initiator protein DnaA [Spirochaetia bacterium]